MISLFNFQGAVAKIKNQALESASRYLVSCTHPAPTISYFLFPNSYVVGSSGLEPPTSRLSGVRSNRLSYEPIFRLEAAGSSLLTSRLSPLGGDEGDRTPDSLTFVVAQLFYHIGFSMSTPKLVYFSSMRRRGVSTRPKSRRMHPIKSI